MTIEMIGENTHVSISSMKELGLKMPFQFHLFKIEKIKYKSKVEQQVSKEWNMLNTSDEQNNIKVIFSEDKIELINLNDASQEISKITEIKGVIIIHVAPNPLLLQPQIDLSSE
jgi:pimeloyl-CoA synthetase